MRSAREETARRLFGAWLSVQMDLKSVDYTLKTYVNDGEPVGELWCQFADMINRETRKSEEKMRRERSGARGRI